MRCEICGKKFDLDKAMFMFNTFNRFNADYEYEFDGECVCYSCAIDKMENEHDDFMDTLRDIDPEAYEDYEDFDDEEMDD